MEEDKKGIEFLKLEYKDWEKMIRFFHEFKDENLTFHLIHLPAPIEILINEYDHNYYNKEYRDLVGYKKSYDDNLNLICTYFSWLLNNNPSEIIVIDPYFFAKYDDIHLKLLFESFILFKNHNLLIYYDNQKLDKEIYKKIIEFFRKNNINTTIKISKELHDRFILAENKYGIQLGGSFNGLLTKTKRISEIDKKDLEEIYNEYKKEKNNG